MENQVSISQDKYTKLKQYAVSFQNIKSSKHLTTKQIRRLQFLIKKHKPTQKTKLFNIINIYKQEKNMLLLAYLKDLFRKIEDNQDLPSNDFTL